MAMNMDDVIVIGGGIIGLSIARALAKRGVKVGVLEAGEPGQGASTAAAGMLAPQYEAAGGQAELLQLCLKSSELHPVFCAELREESGINPQYFGGGTLCPTFSERESWKIIAFEAAQRQAGLPIEILSPEEARRLEPNLSPECRGALFLPHDHRVHTRQLFSALLQATRRAGVAIKTHTPAVSLVIEKNKVAGVRTAHQVFPCRYAVLAAGAWSGTLAKTTPILSLPIRPVKGEIVQLFAPSGKGLTHPLIASRCYIVPRDDGSLLIGATEVEAGFDTIVTAGAVADLVSAAAEAIPEVSSFPFHTAWAGLRPTAPDRLPLLGFCGPEGFVVATGHYRKGILLAPVTGELIAELITARTTQIPLEPFSPTRFAA
jgi:glycine oxidase